MSLSIHGIGVEDADVGSPAVNAMQQVGGAIGIALLPVGKAPTWATLALAHLYSYSTAYWWSAARSPQAL
ncbi:hypothetical protein [Streptomyces sp. NPDC050548]|uniref:hypothetical protein n=1 Tax=Streptomyces sp. NPDC050548 TaxID=3365629 RepID=UPI00378CB5A6